MIRVEGDLSEYLVITKILFCALLGLAALLRGDIENKSLRENWRVKMIAVAGYHTVVCDAFIFSQKLLDHLKSIVIVVDLLVYIHGKHLRSCLDGQLT